MIKEMILITESVQAIEMINNDNRRRGRSVNKIGASGWKGLKTAG